MKRASGIMAHAALWFLAALTLVPFAYLACTAFKPTGDAYTSLFLPGGDGFLGIAWDRLTLENFTRLFGQASMLRATINSLFLGSVTALLASLASAMGGYALARFRFRGRAVITSTVLAALVVPWALLLAPGYQLLFQLGLLDSFAGLILPAIAPAFGLYLFRQAILSSVPISIIEAARMDGWGEVRIFFHLVLPLVRPMLGAFLLVTFLATWNNFVAPQVVLQSPEKLPLAVAVAQLEDTYSQDLGLIMAGTLASIAPVLALFLMLQREFIAGLVSGAVKG